MVAIFPYAFFEIPGQKSSVVPTANSNQPACVVTPNIYIIQPGIGLVNLSPIPFNSFQPFPSNGSSNNFDWSSPNINNSPNYFIAELGCETTKGNVIPFKAHTYFLSSPSNNQTEYGGIGNLTVDAAGTITGTIHLTPTGQSTCSGVCGSFYLADGTPITNTAQVPTIALSFNPTTIPTIICGLSCGAFGNITGFNLPISGSTCCNPHTYPYFGASYGNYAQQQGQIGETINSIVTFNVLGIGTSGSCGGIDPILFPFCGFIECYVGSNIVASFNLPTSAGSYTYHISVNGALGTATIT
jgi:hypothetical protein